MTDDNNRHRQNSDDTQRTVVRSSCNKESDQISRQLPEESPNQTLNSPSYPSPDHVFVSSPSARPNNNDVGDCDNEDDTSAESAAIVRGASRAASQTTIVTRGAAVGRLPLSSSKVSQAASQAASRASQTSRAAASHASRISSVSSVASRSSKASTSIARGPNGVVSRVTPRIPKGPPNGAKVAKASDRVSNMWDVLNAGMEAESNSEPQASKPSQAQPQSHPRQSPQIQQKVQWAHKIMGVTRIFITNALQGMAVFSVYENLVNSVASNSHATDFRDDAIIDKKSTNISPLTGKNEQVGSCKSRDETIRLYLDKDERINEIETYDQDEINRISLPQHVFAGAAGGTAHSVLSLLFEMKVTIGRTISSGDGTRGSIGDVSNTKMTKAKKHMMITFPFFQKNIHGCHSPKVLSLQYPTLHYSFSSLAHHSLAHAVLFGSYQFIKQWLSSISSPPCKHHVLLRDLRPLHDTNKNCKSVDCIVSHGTSRQLNNWAEGYDVQNMTIIMAAGGTAGVLQHVISHYSELWFGLTSAPTTAPTSLSTAVSSSMGSHSQYYWQHWVRKMKMMTYPSWRSVWMAFPPSAVGFLAFEYGKEII